MAKPVMKILLSFLIFVGQVAYCSLKTRNFVYHQDFEGADPVRLKSTRGEYKVNYQGITEEKAYSGKKSYKVDVLLAPGGRYDLEIPLEKIPVVEGLKFSGMIWVKECLPRSRAILGVDFNFWPVMSDASGVRSFPWNVEHQGWVKIQADLFDRAEAFARKSFSREFYYVALPDRPAYTSSYIERIFLQLFTRDAGEMMRRFVVYMDDIRIEGTVPEEKEYQKQAEIRWEEVRERVNSRITGWEEKIKKAEAELKAGNNCGGEGERMKKELERKLNEINTQFSGDLKDSKRTGILRLQTYKRIESFCRQWNNYLRNISVLSQNKEEKKIQEIGCIIYQVNPNLNNQQRILPDTILIPGEIKTEMEIKGCAGEYEPGSFVIKAVKDIKRLKVVADELKGKAGKIPCSEIDIRVVKCWYQDEEGKKVLIPELLLKDDSLVEVDQQKKLSRIRFALADGQKYLSADDPEWPKPISRGESIPDNYPVWVCDDRENLQPVDIPAGSNRQFWVTVKIPDNLTPGDYSGRINLFWDGQPSGISIRLTIRVLPFKLSPSRIKAGVFGSDLGIGSLYYQGKLFPSGYQMVERRYRAVLKNQLAHGITVFWPFLDDGSNADFLGPVFHRQMLKKTLEIRNQLGVPNNIFIGSTQLVHRGLGIFSHKALTEINVPKQTEKDFLVQFTDYLKILRSYGIKDVYFHLADERDARELEAWLPVFDLLRQNGAKVMNSSQIGGSTFPLVAGRIDVFVCENGISRRETAMWHSAGTEVWPIWNPSGGVEDFELSRRQHGVLVWKTKCDGVTEYLYSQESAWLEAASSKTGLGGDGVHSLVYQTASGVIDTIQWEGYREGIDDVRYITTLEEAIKEAKKTGKKRNEVEEAERFLENIDADNDDLDLIRVEITRHIQKLNTRR